MKMKTAITLALALFFQFAQIFAVDDPRGFLPATLLNGSGELNWNPEFLKDKLILIEVIPDLSYLVLRDGKWMSIDRHTLDNHYQFSTTSPSGGEINSNDVRRILRSALDPNSKATVYMTSKPAEAVQTSDYTAIVRALDDAMSGTKIVTDFSPRQLKILFHNEGEPFKIDGRGWGSMGGLFSRSFRLVSDATAPSLFLYSGITAVNMMNSFMTGNPVLDHHHSLALASAAAGVMTTGTLTSMAGTAIRQSYRPSDTAESLSVPEELLRGLDSRPMAKTLLLASGAIFGAPAGVKLCEWAIKAIAATHGYLQ